MQMDVKGIKGRLILLKIWLDMIISDMKMPGVCKVQVDHIKQRFRTMWLTPNNCKR